ncbi:uncharacterized protein TRIADDRAFT_30184 [Trichoplax adhaerens]|uniref:Protein O-mannosyl-transferase 2 n=1 Tax=Trichoplax adhaerens TaxID=10228 RepID=B3S6J8_TRIAD|nr:hypothetical protein TRIADDRAFT_30184 [Trichoplax adhaerens]EDV21774.1 hypothetical protein TRIADDRAFT_30184 [Trichoplax adhaerens]|eukprot:XP_002115922.1 hypothetical protein TRIADDRAFT_30184 [Trichoplax adhaerens]
MEKTDTRGTAKEKTEPGYVRKYLPVICFLLVCLLTCSTRLYKLDEPQHVCWDEAHFGKHGSWYINRTFFFDVHPPLGKMSIGLIGYLTGYNGTFAFDKPGDKFNGHLVMGMRYFCAILGCFFVAFVYLITWELSQSVEASCLASLFAIFDHGTITLSRYILLDPILLFYIMSSTYFGIKFLNTKNRPYSLSWWLWLSLTGVSLGCAISVKFVGLFVILFTGYSTVMDLWRLFGDLNLSMVDLIKHFLARAVCLILIPLLVYSLLFVIHLKVLHKSGKGDGFYSSSFQATLKGNDLYDVKLPTYVAYGSVVTIRNYRSGGALLHSHPHLYPPTVAKMQQQQVTTYSHKDENNLFMIKKHNASYSDQQSLEYVKNGDIIRLEHVQTKRNLHSHLERAPVTKRHYQVTCYGNNGTGDDNDYWVIHATNAEIGSKISIVKSILRFVHYNVKCALHSHEKQLPKWGWEQMEVTCNPKIKHKNNLWNIEGHQNPRLSVDDSDVHKASTYQKFLESHFVMLQGNSNLKPKEGEYTSQPWHWPITYKGQHFSGGDFRIYLLGNPVLWWTNLIVLISFPFGYLYHAIRCQRGCQDQNELRTKLFSSCWWLYLGWATHYIPFYLMGRVLYFHHYFPSYLYSCMITGTCKPK